MESRNKREKQASSNRYTYPLLCVAESTWRLCTHTHRLLLTSAAVSFNRNLLTTFSSTVNEPVISHFAVILCSDKLTAPDFTGSI